MSFYEQLEKMSQDIAEMEQKFEAEQKKFITSLFERFFEEYGEHVKTIGIEASIPYFNDGDPCIFDIDAVIFSSLPYTTYLNNGKSLYTYEEGIIATNLNEWYRQTYPEKYAANVELAGGEEALKDLEALRRAIYSQTNYFNKVFGDYFLIYITADGVFNDEEWSYTE